MATAEFLRIKVQQALMTLFVQYIQESVGLSGPELWGSEKRISWLIINLQSENDIERTVQRHTKLNLYTYNFTLIFCLPTKIISHRLSSKDHTCSTVPDQSNKTSKTKARS